MYKKVLIADDCEEEIKKLQDHFITNGSEVIYAKNPEEVFDEIEKKNIDLLILDWFFVLPSDNALSLQVIDALIENKYYIPVFIYSNKNSQEIALELPQYPSTLMNAIQKPNPNNACQVKDYIDNWFKSNPAVRLANNWYKSIHTAIGFTLEEMYTRINTGVINLLNQTYRTEKDKGASEIISLIVSILQYNLLQDVTLTNSLDNIIETSPQVSEEESLINYDAIRSFEMYIKVDSGKSISTGDVFLLDTDIFSQDAACESCMVNRPAPVYAVAISAECDYANSTKKLRYHKFILGKNLLDTCLGQGLTNAEKIRSFVHNISTHNHDGFHYLPFIQISVGEDIKYENIALDFQNVVAIVKDIHDPYFINKRICRLRPFYFQHLSRRYSAFSGRIGVPEIPKEKISEISECIYQKITG